MVGKVKKILDRGYGFIVTEDGEEYFFHLEKYLGDWDELRDMCPPLTEEGPLVIFTPIEHPRGPRAIRVELVGF